MLHLILTGCKSIYSITTAIFAIKPNFWTFLVLLEKNFRLNLTAFYFLIWFKFDPNMRRWSIHRVFYSWFGFVSTAFAYKSPTKMIMDKCYVLTVVPYKFPFISRRTNIRLMRIKTEVKLMSDPCEWRAKYFTVEMNQSGWCVVRAVWISCHI